MSIEKTKLDYLTNRTTEVKSLRDVVVETIREAIIEGHFQPGEHLKERELSEKMRVSTTPIKEAFRVLGQEGLIETIPRKGTFVSKVLETNIEEIQLLRAAVEGLCAKLAAIKITDSEQVKLEKQIKLMESLLEDNEVDLLVEENTHFHKRIRELADSPMVSKFSINLESFDKAFRKRALKKDSESKQGFLEHSAICKAICSKDSELAEKLMKQHIMRTIKDVLNKEY
jgi:DNA-binding GntR family transcriptional regulator